MIFLVTALSYAGLCAICLSMKRHYRQRWAVDPPRRSVRVLRWSGTLLLAATAGLSVRHWGVGEGLVAGFTCAGAGGLTLVFLMSVRPRLATALAILAPVVAAGLRAY